MAGPDTVDDMRAAVLSASDTVRDQQFNIEHVVALLVLLARDSGGQCVGLDHEGSAEMDSRWLRVEYLADAIARHAAGLTVALDGLDATLNRIGRAAA